MEDAYMGYDRYLNTPRVDCRNTQALVIVMTGIGSFRERQLIRLTWGRGDQLALAKAALVFVIGDFSDRHLQEEINEEAKQFGDILQGSFEEDYYALAYKSMSAFHWSQHFCHQVPWIAKTDDDTVNDMWQLQHTLQDMERHDGDRDEIGCLHKTDFVIRPPAEPGFEKWEVSESEYPEEEYPTNCYGTFYLLSSNVRDRLYQAFIDRERKIFKIDDVFTTGILAKEAGIKHRQLEDLISTDSTKEEFEEQLNSGKGFHHVMERPGEMTRYWMWRRIVERRTSGGAGN